MKIQIPFEISDTICQEYLDIRMQELFEKFLEQDWLERAGQVLFVWYTQRIHTLERAQVNPQLDEIDFLCLQSLSVDNLGKEIQEAVESDDKQRLRALQRRGQNLSLVTFARSSVQVEVG